MIINQGYVFRIFFIVKENKANGKKGNVFKMTFIRKREKEKVGTRNGQALRAFSQLKSTHFKIIFRQLVK